MASAARRRLHKLGRERLAVTAGRATQRLDRKLGYGGGDVAAMMDFGATHRPFAPPGLFDCGGGGGGRRARTAGKKGRACAF